MIGLSLMILMMVCVYIIEVDLINFIYFFGFVSNELIVLYEFGNEWNLGLYSLDNEVVYMKWNWLNVYVLYFVGFGGWVK